MVYIKTKYNNKTYELRNISQLITLLASEQYNSSNADKKVPSITWNPVQNVNINSELGSDVLNAEATYYDGETTINVGGTFIYTPEEGYIPTQLGTLTIKMMFVPSDLNEYNIVQTENTINMVIIFLWQ